MDIQTKINNLKYWFFQTLEKETKPYFMLAKPHGNGRQQITNQEGGDVDALWENLERNIWNEYNNGVRRFLVTIRKGGMKGSAFESELDLGWGVQNGGVASINGTPSQPAQVGGIYGTEYLSAITGLTKIQADFEAFKRESDLKQQIKDREMEIAALQMDSRSQLEKISDGIGAIMENINSMGGFEGIAKLVYALKANPAAAGAAMQGIFGTADAAKPSKRTIKEQPAPEGATVPHSDHIEGTDTEDEADSEPSELTEDQELALEAVELLESAGFDKPGELLHRVARFAANDPANAKNFLNYLPA